ncbi:MAG TPA: hypothetical protein VFW40_00075 [Capsulimonadaceae bacterium]|nr:hypothetical protein [Capsulimonadaceae bacterium]
MTRISPNGGTRLPIALLLAGLLILSLSFAPALGTRAAAATTTHKATTIHHKKNWVQRHPTLTAIGAGVVTHHALKVAAARDKARGKKLNWAERHPTLSAVGVGVVTHHVIKKHTPR